MKLAFATTALSFRTPSPWLNGCKVTSFTTNPRYMVKTVRKRSVIRQWFVVTATSTSPSSSSSSDDENDKDEMDNQQDTQSSTSSTPRANRSDDGSRDSEFDVDLTGTSEEDENELFQFVKSVPPPELVKKFSQAAPPVVQNAIRETLVSMLGSLPPLAFSTNVSTMSSNLVQLFHSSLVTGYMFRNATYRLELTRSLDWSGLKALPAEKEQQPIIKGGIAIFKQDDGSTMEVPVEQYISDLRQTVNNLQSELTRERKGGNELLSFISTMENDNLEALTKNAGSEVVEAMKKVCDVVTKSQGILPEQEKLVQASAPELGQLLFYLMVSGFFLREAEVHLDLQRKLGGDGSSLKNLLEGGSSETSSN